MRGGRYRGGHIPTQANALNKENDEVDDDKLREHIERNRQWQIDKFDQVDGYFDLDAYNRACIDNLIHTWGYSPEELRYHSDGRVAYPDMTDMLVHQSRMRAAEVEEMLRLLGWEHVAPDDMNAESVQSGGNSSRRRSKKTTADAK